MAEAAFYLILENLKKLTNCKADLSRSEKDQIEFLYGELEFLMRTFIKDWEGNPYENGKANNLMKRIMDVAHKAEDAIELFITNKEKNHKMKGEDTDLTKKNCRVINRFSIKKAIKAIKRDIKTEEKINEDTKTEELEIYNNKKHTHNIGPIQVGESSNRDQSRENTSLLGEEELVVGFDDEATMIKDQLTGGQKLLDVISIVGMPGIGKTTLARKVYNDPLIAYHFYIRAWICVSQEYQTQDLLRSLLSSVIQDTDKISDEKLGEELRKRSKGKRYLIVMDDMWDTGAWVHLKSSFPNDNNGSRIILTSRIADVALQVKPDSHPLFLHYLSENESWDLFQHKAFRRQPCPPELTEIGKEIAKKCQGVPLTIVVAAGILANKDKTLDQWKQVGKALSSNINVDQLCTETLALSYNHLPRHLKPCFLYFGVFPEDYEIPFHKLICLWIAEGFIREIGNKVVVLEDLAEEYLLDLIGRSLVTVSKRRSDGGIKACHMHDLLRDFCLKKVEEEYFLLPITDESLPKHFLNFRRLFIHQPISLSTFCIHFTLYSHSHSLLYFDSRNSQSQPLEFICSYFTLLRVLDISSIRIYNNGFVSGLVQLVLLRYLALSWCYEGYNIRDSISKLINLETLILRQFIPTVLPHSIWKMVKLRHLWFTGMASSRIEKPVGNAEDYPSSLDSLHTLSYVDPWSCQDILTRTPNLRKLGFRGHIVSSAGLTFPDIHFLNHLKKLKLINTKKPTLSDWSTNLEGILSPPSDWSTNLEGILSPPSDWSTNLQGIKFPSNLKSLTLESTYLKWDDMSSLSKLLPNLEVLKLGFCACEGRSWETCGVFPRLRFLKFHGMWIREWKLLSSNYFPCLQRLVLNWCSKLERIPSEIGDIPTLQMIEVTACSDSAELSAKEIQEEQRSMGNDGLQIIIKSY